MAVPPYSVFSAASELFVTAAVFYILWMAYAQGRFRTPMFLLVLGFEFLANVTYMAYRLAIPAAEAAPRTTGMTLLLAAHGVLSLAMYIVFAVYGWAVLRVSRDGRNLLREAPGGLWTFVGFWTLSVGSGELIFVLTYLA